jgi:rSAM/selenodomain-associated transferase 1
VLVFVRAPRPGRVKTRLAATIGAGAALRVYRRLAEHTLREARGVESAAVRVHVDPAGAEEEVRGWLGGGAAYLPQAEGELGERMRRAFEEAFAAGNKRVVIVGSDLPGLSTGLLRRALEALEAREVVLGPARDGGYYLLGLRRVLPELFREIPWSTGEVLSLTRERLAEQGVEPLLLEELADVDEVGDLPPGWETF